NQLEIENQRLKLELENIKKNNSTDLLFIKKNFVENVKKLTDLLYANKKKPPHTNYSEFIEMLQNYDKSLVDFYHILYESLNPEAKSNKTNEKLKTKTMLLVSGMYMQMALNL